MGIAGAEYFDSTEQLKPLDLYGRLWPSPLPIWQNELEIWEVHLQFTGNPFVRPAEAVPLKVIHP